jgi:hypothetical protein
MIEFTVVSNNELTAETKQKVMKFAERRIDLPFGIAYQVIPAIGPDVWVTNPCRKAKALAASLLKGFRFELTY